MHMWPQSNLCSASSNSVQAPGEILDFPAEGRFILLMFCKTALIQSLKSVFLDCLMVELEPGGGPEVKSCCTSEIFSLWRKILACGLWWTFSQDGYARETFGVLGKLTRILKYTHTLKNAFQRSSVQ